MPRRFAPLVTEEIYHIFNRSIARVPIFLSFKDYHRALNLIDFYRFQKPSIRFSHYNRLPVDARRNFLYALYQSPKLVEIYSFCLMPNHFHFLLKQLSDKGVERFAEIFQNSYAKYLNTRTKRTGSAFQASFKAVRVETDEQFIHLCRYIHLNPLTSYVLKDLDELIRYPWSSYPDYISGEKRPFIETRLIRGFFSDNKKLSEFHRSQVEYQRTLDKIRHLVLEEN